MEAPNTVLIKLASIAVHLQEAADPGGERVDVDTATQLAQDPDVVAWLTTLDPALLPVRRDA